MKSNQYTILINVDDAIYLHDLAIERFGGLSGIRDITLLESALDQPLKVMEYGLDQEQEIEYLASTYFFHIIKNHAFVDGNKRAGLLVAITFLEKNGFTLDIDFELLYTLALETAESRIDKNDVAKVFKKALKPIL